jgi:hypothetical protein
MEVGLAMLLVTSTVLVFRREMPAGRFRYTPVLALLLALVRPEGLIFAAVLTFAAWYLLWAQRWATGQAGLWRRWSWTLLPAARRWRVAAVLPAGHRNRLGQRRPGEVDAA